VTTSRGLLLGALQGATEFLPVSSSGHLVMGQALLGISLPGILFEVVVHVATLLSVLVVYRARILDLAGGALVERSPEAWRYLDSWLAVATLPVGVVGVLFGDRSPPSSTRPGGGSGAPGHRALLFSSRWALRRPLDRGSDGGWPSWWGSPSASPSPRGSPGRGPRW
jgi:hypothetical protein